MVCKGEYPHNLVVLSEYFRHFVTINDEAPKCASERLLLHVFTRAVLTAGRLWRCSKGSASWFSSCPTRWSSMRRRAPCARCPSTALISLCLSRALPAAVVQPVWQSVSAATEDRQVFEHGSRFRRRQAIHFCLLIHTQDTELPSTFETYFEPSFILSNEPRLAAASASASSADGKETKTVGLQPLSLTRQASVRPIFHRGSFLLTRSVFGTVWCG